MSSLEFTSIGNTFGTRVRGVQPHLLQAHPEATEKLRQRLRHEGVLVLSGMDIGANDFVGLLSLFGQVRPARVKHASLPLPASDYVFVGQRTADTPQKLTRGDVAHVWHVDYSTSGPIPQYSAQYTVKADPGGGTLGFADMRQVHAALPEHTKTQIQHLWAIHYEHPVGVDVEPPGQAAALSWDERHQGTAHPLVMHDSAGRPFLCLPARPDSPIQGWSERTSAELLDFLWSHLEPHGSGWEYEPQAGDIVIWDNRALAHKRAEWPLNKERLAWFITTN